MSTAKKRPFGFWVCSLSYTFERMAYYAAKYILTIFVASQVVNGGLGLTDVDAAKISANLVAFTYISPLIGGYITDRYVGARKLVPVGTLLMAAGYVCGYFASVQTSLAMTNAMIILVSIGTAFFKSQVSAINGRLFDSKEELDAAFSIQYSFVNIGSFIGTTFIGAMVANGDSFQPAFLICAAIMVVCTVWFIVGARHFGDIGLKPFKAEEEKVDATGKEEKQPLTKNEKQRIVAIFIVSIFSIIFWLFWYLAYQPVYFYWPEHMNWNVGGFQVPTSYFDSLNGFTCMALGPIMAVVWAKLAARPQGDLDMFKKTSLGLLLLGISFVIFAGADVVRGDGQASLLWIVAFGIVLSLGEMVFSPLGNSFVSKFAPARLLTVMLGVWNVATFFSAKSYGYLYEFLQKFPFAQGYFAVAAIAIVSAVVLWAISGKLNSLVEE